MRDDLQYDLCLGCGEIKPRGIIEAATHACPLNTFTYYGGRSFSIRQLKNLVQGKDELLSFKDLLRFDHFAAMPNFETATETEKIIYRIYRDSDIRTMKRLRKYIELEERFEASY